MPITRNVAQYLAVIYTDPSLIKHYGYLRPRDVNLQFDADSRIAKMSCVIEQDANIGTELNVPFGVFPNTWTFEDAYPLLTAGASVYLIQETTTGTLDQIRFVGDIIEISENRLKNTNYKSLSVLGWEQRTQQVRFQRTWENQTARQIIVDAWTSYTPEGFSITTGLIGVNNTIIESIDSLYDTLYDVLQAVCRLTGWAWRIDLQLTPPPTFRGRLVFYDPQAVASSTITQPLDIEGSTLRQKTSLAGVFNQAIMIGYLYEQAQAMRTVAAGQCIQELYLNDPKYTQGWELSNLDAGKLSVDGFPDATGNYTSEGVVRLDEGFTSDVATVLRVNLLFRQPRWVYAEDTDSVNTYGARMAPPLSNDGGLNIFTAKQILDQFLIEKSTPRIDLELAVTKLGFTIDSLSTVTLTDPAFSGPMYVRAVNRTTRGVNLDIVLQLTNSIGEGATFARLAPDPAVDMARRIARLERQNLHPATPAGSGAEDVGLLENFVEVADSWQWTEDTETDFDDFPIMEVGITVPS